MARYDLSSTTLGTLLKDPEVVAILEQHAPGITSNPMISMAEGMPAGQALDMAGGMISPTPPRRSRPLSRLSDTRPANQATRFPPSGEPEKPVGYPFRSTAVRCDRAQRGDQVDGCLDGLSPVPAVPAEG